MEDKVVELTRFSQVSEAEMLVSLLKSEGIDCYARGSVINDIYRGIDIGGVKVELLEKDLQHALEIMKDYGYLPSQKNPDMQNSEDLELTEKLEIADDADNSKESEIVDVSEEALEEYKRNKAKLSKTMIIGCVVIIAALVGLILLNRYYNG